MKKNKKYGFTLIELLAVIVILAIIALIATPIVLNIINASKESATLRSADFYLDAVEFSIAERVLESKSISNGTYEIMQSGNICLGTVTNGVCSDEMVVEVNGEVPTTGTITITDGEISDIGLDYQGKYIVYDEKNNLVYGNPPVCILVKDADNSGTVTAGDKYECEVKKGTKYNFYVLGMNEDGTTNLIMDRHVYYDSATNTSGAADSTNEGKVEWMSSSNYGCLNDSEDTCPTNEKGPVTAMTYLHNATKSWTNITPMNYTYNDKEMQGATAENTSYTSFVSTNGIATITSISGEEVIIGSNETPLRARLPIYSSDSTKTEVADRTDANAYLYENFDGINGYWTLSTYVDDSDSSEFAWIVYGDWYMLRNVVDAQRNGVRPVITLKI